MRDQKRNTLQSRGLAGRQQQPGKRKYTIKRSRRKVDIDHSLAALEPVDSQSETKSVRNGRGGGSKPTLTRLEGSSGIELLN